MPHSLVAKNDKDKAPAPRTGATLRGRVRRKGATPKRISNPGLRYYLSFCQSGDTIIVDLDAAARLAGYLAAVSDNAAAHIRTEEEV